MDGVLRSRDAVEILLQPEIRVASLAVVASAPMVCRLDVIHQFVHAEENFGAEIAAAKVELVGQRHLR